jgi:hypothetical protein
LVPAAELPAGIFDKFPAFGDELTVPKTPARQALDRVAREALQRSMFNQVYKLSPVVSSEWWVWEYQFHPTRKFCFDIAAPGVRLAIEVNGGQWLQKGGHNTGPAVIRDAEKFAEAAILGWTVLAFPGSMVEDGSALKLVEKWFQTQAQRRAE